jgi:hypothetical protein
MTSSSARTSAPTRACARRRTRPTDVRADQPQRGREDHSTHRQRRHHAADPTQQKARPPSITVRGNPRRDALASALAVDEVQLIDERVPGKGRRQPVRTTQRLPPSNTDPTTREHAAAVLAEYVRAVVDSFPPLTPEQRDRIAALLRTPGNGGSDPA